MLENILDLAIQQNPYVIKVRRYLHENPEVSDKEDKTVEYILNELQSMGITGIEVPRGGIIAFLGDADNNDAKTILLRADIDALPILETEHNMSKPKVCVSKNVGVSQGCGHDSHTAMLLGAAQILKANESHINGRVMLMFERGEEGTENIIYIHRYLEKHNIRVDSSYGIHVMSYVNSGQYMGGPGPLLAGAFKFEIRIEGRGGHGSLPTMAKSPVDCFNSIYNGMNMLRMREVNPFNPLTFSVGSVETSSHAQNVIPESLTFSGTMRVYDHKQGVQFVNALRKLIDNECDTWDCTPVYIKFDGPGYGVVNHKECAELSEQIVAGFIGAENVVHLEPLMGSETHAYTQQLYPGTFGLLGIYNEEKGTGANHHTPEFDVDEDVLHVGVATHVAYALAYLDSDIDVSADVYAGTLKEMYAASAVPAERMDAFDD